MLYRDNMKEVVVGGVTSVYNIGASLYFKFTGGVFAASGTTLHETVNEWMTSISLLVGIAVGIVSLYRFFKTREKVKEPA